MTSTGLRALAYLLPTAALIGLAAPAKAQDQAQGIPSADLFEKMQACRTIADDAARLTCFDATSAQFSAAVESKEIVVVEDKDLKETKKSLFGFRLPSLSIFGAKDDDSEESKTLASTVKSARALPGGRFTIVLAEGATWQTTEGLPFPPAPGDSVEIKSAALGSYFLKVGRRRPVRAMRVE